MAKEEEGRMFDGVVECGWTEITLGSYQKNRSSPKELRIFGIWWQEAVSLAIRQKAGLQFGKQMVRQKVEIGSEVMVGSELKKEFSKDTRILNAYALLSSYRSVPPNLLKIFGELTKEIQTLHVPYSKIPLHIAEFVWLYNHKWNSHKEEDEKVHSIIRTLGILKN